MKPQPEPLGTPRSDLAAAAVGIERVPEQFRVLGFFDHFVLWADLGVGLLVLAAGSYLVPGLSLPQALLVIVLGTLLGNLMLGLAGVIGSEHAIPSMVSLRPSFGRRGSYLPSLINVVQLVGWGAYEIVIMATASSRLSGPILGIAGYPIWAIFWGAIVLLLALGGPLVVVRQWLEKAGIWVVLLTVSWMALYALTHGDLGASWNKPGDGSSNLAQGLDLVVAMPISWLPIVADFNRFARTSRSSFAGTFAGFGLANAMCFTLGVLLVLVLPAGDLTASIMSITFGAAGLVLLLGDETDNAFADVYSTAISIKNVAPGLPTRGLLAAVGGTCVAIALAVDMNSFQNFLLLVGSLFTPLFGVLFADYFILRRRRYTEEELYPADARGGPPWGGVNPVALVAWAAGAAVYWAETTYVHTLGGTLPSLAASMGVYLAVSVSIGALRRPRSAVAH